MNDPTLNECISLDSGLLLVGAQQSCVELMRSYWKTDRSWRNFSQVFSEHLTSDEIIYACMCTAHETGDKEGYVLGQELLDLPVSLRHALLEVDVDERFAISTTLLAALESIREKWDELMPAKPSPFSNNASAFVCDVFSVEAYSWTNENQSYNFKWGDVEVSWYKYFGRSMTANRPVSRSEAGELMTACLNALELASSGGLKYEYR